jgi:hypothetical protein
MPAPASSTNDAAICVTANSRRRRFVPDVIRTLPLESPRPPTASADGRRGTNASSTAAVSARLTPTHSRLASTVRSRREQRSGTRNGRRRHPQRDDHTENGAAAAEQQAFREQRLAQPAGPGAERRPYGQLTLPPDGSGQDQVRDVGTRNDEDQRRRGEQDEEHRSRVRRDLIPQPLRVDLEVGPRRVRLGVFVEEGAVYGAQLGARRLEIRAGRKAAEQLRHPMGAASHHRRRQVVRARDDVRDDLGFGRIGHRWLEDADDRS